MRKLSFFLTLLIALCFALSACTTAPGTLAPTAAETEAPLDTEAPVETAPAEPEATQPPATEAAPEITQAPAVTDEAVTAEATTAATAEATAAATEAEATTGPDVTGTEIIPETGMQGQVRATTWLNQPVTTVDNEQAGEVADIAINLVETDVEYLLLRLPVEGEEQNPNVVTPVPWRAFRVNPDGGLLVVVGSDVLQGGTTLDVRAVPMLIPEDWSEEFGAYWDEQLPASTPETAPETGEATPEATPEEASLEGIILASDLIDQTIQLTNGQEIGSVLDLVIDVSNGQITYVLLSPGADLGLGEVIPVPIQALRRNAETLAFQLEIDPDALQNAPNFSLEDLTDTNSQEWLEALRNFWESVQAP